MASEQGHQDVAVTEQRDPCASGHDPLLELQIGDAAFVDAGVEWSADALHDRGLVSRTALARLATAGRRELVSYSSQPGSGATSRASNWRTRAWVRSSSGQCSSSRLGPSVACRPRRDCASMIHRAASRGEGGHSRGMLIGRPRRRVAMAILIRWQWLR